MRRADSQRVESPALHRREATLAPGSPPPTDRQTKSVGESPQTKSRGTFVLPGASAIRRIFYDGHQLPLRTSHHEVAKMTDEPSRLDEIRPLDYQHVVLGDRCRHAPARALAVAAETVVIVHDDELVSDAWRLPDARGRPGT